MQQELRAACPHQTADAKHLARVQFKADAMQIRASPRMGCHVQVLHPKQTHLQPDNQA